MRALSASELLEVWERAVAQAPAERALLLLGAACDDRPPDALSRLSVGRRDALLLTLREQTFGPQLTSLADCPRCGASLELNLNVSDLRVEREDEAASSEDGSEDESTATLSLSVAGYEASFRLPHSLDLAAVATSGRTDDTAAGEFLLDRCLIEARRGGERLRAGQLPTEVAEAIAGRMAEADPQAELQFALSCVECGARWQTPFDIESFFWAEIDAWARRVLGEVHVLASAYGWRESDILGMSAWRRQCYLNLING